MSFGLWNPNKGASPQVPQDAQATAAQVQSITRATAIASAWVYDNPQTQPMNEKVTVWSSMQNYAGVVQHYAVNPNTGSAVPRPISMSLIQQYYLSRIAAVQNVLGGQ